MLTIWKIDLDFLSPSMCHQVHDPGRSLVMGVIGRLHEHRRFHFKVMIIKRMARQVLVGCQALNVHADRKVPLG